MSRTMSSVSGGGISQTCITKMFRNKRMERKWFKMYIHTHTHAIPWIRSLSKLQWDVQLVINTWNIQSIQNCYSAKYCTYFMHGIMNHHYTWKVHLQSKRSVYLRDCLMLPEVVPFHSSELWDQVVNCWKFWYQHRMYLNENMRDGIWSVRKY